VNESEWAVCSRGDEGVLYIFGGLILIHVEGLVFGSDLFEI
jgi:hypothetical protein